MKRFVLILGTIVLFSGAAFGDHYLRGVLGVKNDAGTSTTYEIDGETPSFTIGAGVAATDYALTFNGETADGTITWMEDESRWDLDGHLQLGKGTAGVDYVLSVDGETNDGTLTYDEDNDKWIFGEGVDVTGTCAATTVTGANVTSGADPGHTHTGASLGSIDISADTNLAVSSPIVLTDDTLSFNAGSLDHGTIGGLSDDDHTQYSLADGTRAFTGNVTIGANQDVDYILTFDGATNNITLTGMEDEDALKVSGNLDIDGTGTDTFAGSLDVEGTVTVGAGGDLVIDSASAKIYANNGTNDFLSINAKGTGDIFFNNAAGDDVEFRGGDSTADVSVTSEGDIVMLGRLCFSEASEKTIATGAITINGSNCEVDTESDAASDDLDTINGGINGVVLILRAANDARTVVVKDGTGNIKCGGDRSLDSIDDSIMLLYDTGTTSWIELSFSDNG